MRFVTHFICFFTITLFFIDTSEAQRIANASIKVSEIVLDGKLNEIDWAAAEGATGLTQYSPNTGDAS